MSDSSDVERQIAALIGALPTSTKPTGKTRISMQGLENAISGQKIFMPADEFAAYLNSGAEFVESLRPVGYREEQLTQKIIDANWWLNRSSALENNLLMATRLENSVRSDRSTDIATETIMAQALGYRDECAGSNAFEMLSRCTSRVSRIFVEMNRELERVQEKRIAVEGDVFQLGACRVHIWYAEQIRRAEAKPEISISASSTSRIEFVSVRSAGEPV